MVSLFLQAFSGSHQDAISKGMHYRIENDPNKWTVPYLPINPEDVGRTYDSDVIRINSQSGKGGVAYVLEHNYGMVVPKAMREDLGYAVRMYRMLIIRSFQQMKFLKYLRRDIRNTHQYSRFLKYISSRLMEYRQS